MDKLQEDNLKEDNIYIYNEEEDPDDSPYNFASIENQEEDEEQLNEEEDKKKHPFSLLLEVMFNPVQGWKRIRRLKLTAENMQSGCFYPLLAILALSKFSDYFYVAKANLSMVVSQAIVAFVSYFFGYFCVIIFMKNIFSKPVSDYMESNFGKIFIMLPMSTLVLFSIFTNLFPMLWPILIFLPLWTLYIMYKGIRFFKLGQSQVLKFTVLSCVSVIGFPELIDWLLNMILP